MEGTGTGFVNVDTKSAYSQSFGYLSDGMAYYNPQMKSDLREELGNVFKIGLKALGPTAGGAGTAGYALVPIYVDNRIVDLSRKYVPFVEMISRVSNMGLTADYNVIESKGSAYTAGLDAPLPEADDVYDRKSKAIKFLYSVGRVLGQMQSAMPSYMAEGFTSSGAGMKEGNPFANLSMPNAMQHSVLMKARALKELEENLIWNGDSSTDATQFDGIIAQQGTTNRVNADGSALTWGMVEEAIRTAFDAGGRPKVAGASSAVVEDLRNIMINTFGYRPTDIMNAELPFGVPPQLTLQTMVGAIPVFPSMFLSNVSGSKSIYFLDTDFIEMRVLQDMTYEDLAKTNDSKKFMLKIYECLILRAPEFNSFVANIL